MHSPFRYEQQEAFMILVGELADLQPGESVRVHGEVPIAVFNVDDELYAIDDTCSHQDASLSDGWLEGCAVECPLHAACFDLRTGQPSGPPAKKPVRTHAVSVEDGLIYVHESTRVTVGGAVAEEVG
ncbi:bifunctional 3-phenylpropionate/cinnamic acid dioxygenase ferredoxin subunit [Saccharopolyspora halophila]|uniref:Bifunctional 3-phenylpropionate/cinnamic acid dioxygenase ferredoxin subunit n=2 Tax=Saccharopolyspora halophila TaxID=405551 RepID=A0ABN3GXI0_9PSEU